MNRTLLSLAAVIGWSVSASIVCAQDIAVRAGVIHTVSGEPIRDGVVIVRAGKIAAVGPAGSMTIPAGMEVVECAVLTPGLVDVRTTAGLTGIYNQQGDQDHRDESDVIQPQLRATDAYNPREKLIGYIRSFGVTTIHTGHSPGELISGQTMIAKTVDGSIDDAVMVPFKAVSATLDPIAQKGGGKSPGTRGKMVAMLRQELVKAQEYVAKQKADTTSPQADGADSTTQDGDEKPASGSRDLKMEALASVLTGEVPLMIMANKAQDIEGALRLADEFGFTLWLDMACDVQLMLPEVKAAGVPVLLHPTMYRAYGSTENLSFATARVLADAGVPFAIQSGYEGYVPKVRVVLFEAAAAAGVGQLGFQRALESVTLHPARILGIEDRVGSIQVGMDGDLAMYDGDPFEYTTHCIGTIIDGVRYSGEQEFEVGYP